MSIPLSISAFFFLKPTAEIRPTWVSAIIPLDTWSHTAAGFWLFPLHFSYSRFCFAFNAPFRQKSP